jgi:hypothetical protein
MRNEWARPESGPRFSRRKIQVYRLTEETHEKTAEGELDLIMKSRLLHEGRFWTKRGAIHNALRKENKDRAVLFKNK